MIIEQDDGSTINLRHPDRDRPDELVEVEFQHVTITVPNCRSPQQAYDRLCNLLAGADMEFTTDRYAVYPRQAGAQVIEGETSELFPKTLDGTRLPEEA